MRIFSGRSQKFIGFSKMDKKELIDNDSNLSQSLGTEFRRGKQAGILIGVENKRSQIIAMLDNEYKLISKKGTLSGQGKTYDEGYLQALQDIIVLTEEIFSE